MIGQIIHDNEGNIRSVVIQSTEIEGELEIQTDQEGELVSTVDERDFSRVSLRCKMEDWTV
jgi:hypothetical protein